MRPKRFGWSSGGMALAGTLCLFAVGGRPASWMVPPSAAQQPPAAPSRPSGEQKIAAEAFKNLQVLKDIPADQLLPAMRYITVALGVRCDFCHLGEEYEKDDKPKKATARKMMQMTVALNKDNFDGRREVTCYTCHRGVSDPGSVPKLAEFAALAAARSPSGSPNAPAAPPSSLPSVAQVFEKYTQALGGAQAIEKITARVGKGTLQASPQSFHASLEVYWKAPDKSLTILHAPFGDISQGFNGATAWQRGPRGRVGELSGEELMQARRWAELFPALHYQQDYSRLAVSGVDKIGERDVYLVMAWWGSHPPDRLFFDAQTGLLLRIYGVSPTALGSLPQETDYEDYRQVDGVQVPATIRVVRGEGSLTYKLDQIQNNQPLDDGWFDKPENPPLEPPPQPPPQKPPQEPTHKPPERPSR